MHSLTRKSSFPATFGNPEQIEKNLVVIFVTRLKIPKLHLKNHCFALHCLIPMYHSFLSPGTYRFETGRINAYHYPYEDKIANKEANPALTKVTNV
jgi:hypothetical protein